MGHLGPELTGFLAAWLPPVPARVLEIGCGDGALTARLADQGFDVVGIAAIERGELKPADARLALELVQNLIRAQPPGSALRLAIRP